jgi:hypothetical protein
MEITELRENWLLQRGALLVKVSTVYPERFTATVCLEAGKAPERTTVRTYLAMDAALFHEPDDKILRRYDTVYGFTRETS